MTRTFARVAALTLGAALLSAGPLRAQTQTTFHRYVALGDSVTMGVQGNCAVSRNQLTAFPHLLAGVLGISDFQTPTVAEKALTSPLTGNPCLNAVLVGSTITVGPVSQMGGPTNAALARPYDNLGFGSAKTADLVDLTVSNPEGNSVNQAAALVLRNFPPSPFVNKSAVDEANLLQPDLVTLWIGNNDVLGAALAGVALDGVTMTPTAVFTQKYTAVINGIKATGRTIVTLNIPDVTALAFTTTIPPVVVNPATRQPVLVNGQPVSLLGSRALPPGCPTAPCPIPLNTLVTLQASSLLAQGIGIPTALGGTGQGLPDGGFTPPTLNQGVLLYPDEVASIQAHTNELNAQIASIGAANGAIAVDVHGIYNEIRASGYEIGGITVTSAFLTGGLFSADGFHPSNIAHGIVATKIVDAVNAAKGTDISEPNLNPILFTPNVPQPVASVTAGAGPWGYTREMGEALLGLFPPVAEEVRVEPISMRAVIARPTRPSRTVVREPSKRE